LYELKEPPNKIGGLNFFQETFGLDSLVKLYATYRAQKYCNSGIARQVFFLLACAIEAALSNSDKIIASKILQERDHEIRQRYML